MAACKKNGVSVMSTLSQLAGVEKDPITATKRFYIDGGRILVVDIDIMAINKGCKEAADLRKTVGMKVTANPEQIRRAIR